jgi:hypothetical protein
LVREEVGDKRKRKRKIDGDTEDWSIALVKHISEWELKYNL